MRKPHPSSVLKNLPDDDQAALFEFMGSVTVVDGKPKGKTLDDGVKWLFSNNGVRTSDSSLSEWLGWYQMRQQITAWNADADELKALLSTEQSFDPNLVAKIAEAVFVSKAAKTGDPKVFALVAGIVQRHMELGSQQKAHADKMALEEKKLARKDRSLGQADRKLAQAERKLELLEAKVEKVKDAMDNETLTPEEKTARWKQVFGR